MPAGGGCVDLTTDPNNCGMIGNTCRSSQQCVGGMCQCRPGLTEVAGVGCVNLQTDPRNCGMVGNVCGTATPVCSAGTCIPRATGGGMTCPTGTTLCGGFGGGGGGGSCVNTMTDFANCGGCGNRCANDEICDPTMGCVPYFGASTCSACPCAACVAPFDTCSTYGTQTICVGPG
jgi:hypothetical protein